MLNDFNMYILFQFLLFHLLVILGTPLCHIGVKLVSWLSEHLGKKTL